MEITSARRGDINEESLTILHQVAWLQMNISDSCYFLSYHYCSEKAQNGFGAYIQYQTSIRWFEAKSTLKYIVGRGNKVCLPDIQRPEIDYQSHMDTLMGVLNLEKELTRTLQILYDRASTFIDTQTLNFVRVLLQQQSKNEECLQQEIELRKQNYPHQM